MPAPIPARDRNVYFVGAGLSVAMGLPNTAMLLDGVLDLARRSSRWRNEGLEDRLDRAFKYFYPDAIHAGYRPEVVDFFSALRTYLDVGAGLPGGFADAPHLYRSLKSAIAHLLIEKLRQANKGLRAGHPLPRRDRQTGQFRRDVELGPADRAIRTAPRRSSASLGRGRAGRGRGLEASWLD
jgi:hypothetical protein